MQLKERRKAEAEWMAYFCSLQSGEVVTSAQLLGEAEEDELGQVEDAAKELEEKLRKRSERLKGGK